jgi:outer membrane lipoprotein-sorting protein
MRLGLPDLSSFGGPATGTDLTTLLSGSHTAQVSYGGPDRQRVAVLDSLVETEIVRNGRNVWIYDSRTQTTTHHLLPADSDGAHADLPGPSASFDPARLADDLLRAVDPTTTVTVDRTARIAGRAAYQVVLAPKQRGSLIRSVRIGVDAATHVPLRVQVFGADSAPAVELGFVDVSFKAPPASTFTFTPPPGSLRTEEVPSQPRPGTITRRRVGPGQVRTQVRPLPPGFGTFGPVTYTARPKVVGEGWTAVAELSVKSLPPGTADLLTAAGERVGDDVLLRTKLLTVLLKPDGRVYAGAVTPAVLDAAAQ